MKALILLLSVMLSLMLSLSALAADPQALSEGTVKKLDVATSRVTLAHGPIDNLAMPPMTMTFAVKDKALLKGLKAGDKVRFHAEQIDDKLVVTQLKR